ncbi:MAG: divalent metal cation transporter [Actinomycetota bacterium]|nr:divalent metal cation transporter [Actinomycetota bacterium]
MTVTDSGGPRRDPEAGPAGPRSPSEDTNEQRRRWVRLVAVFGPGLMVMLADTDAGSLVTAAQSGAQWSYRLVLPQLALIPILDVIQDVTVRLGSSPAGGHGALIRRHFGRNWALLSGGTLFVACIGALITEFAGIAGAGQLAGLPPWLTVPPAALALCLLVVRGRYRRIEAVGIIVGLLELAPIPAAVLAHPSGSALVHGLAHPVAFQSSYLTLLAAKVGAVIMPWMVFYQQQAVVDKGLQQADLKLAKVDTAVGSVLTQVVMLAVVVATAATIGRTDPGASLDTIGQIAKALVPFLGNRDANVLFGLGMVGAAVVAALVVAVAGAWGLSEVLGWRHSFNDRLSHARAFYAVCAGGLIVSAAAVVTDHQLVNLSVDVQVMNALLLPVVLGFLLVLERRALPDEHRTHGLRTWVLWVLAGGVTAIGVYAAVGGVA